MPVILYVVRDGPFPIQHVQEKSSAGLKRLRHRLEYLRIVRFRFQVAERRVHIDDRVEAPLKWNSAHVRRDCLQHDVVGLCGLLRKLKVSGTQVECRDLIAMLCEQYTMPPLSRT